MASRLPTARHAVKHNRRLVANNFIDSDPQVREDIAAGIQTRAQALFVALQPTLTQAEFGSRIGRGYSWVSAFFAGKRHADVDTLVAMARVFGVTVGDLLGERGRPKGPILAAILKACEELDEKGLRIVLGVAQSLPKATGSPTPESGSVKSDAETSSTRRKRPKSLPVEKEKPPPKSS